MLKRKGFCRLRVFVLVFLLCSVDCSVHVTDARATNGVPGTLVRQESCSPLAPYEDLDKFAKWYFSQSVYEDARSQTNYECSHIWYLSDDIPISGYVLKPKLTENRLWPVILYARGGTGNFGVINDLNRVELYLLAKEGYVVVATDYRWTGERARQDDWGAQTVNDILNLVPLVKNLRYADVKRMFLLGVSRGGTMTYMALRAGIPVTAAAVVAGPSDLETLVISRPDFLTGDEYSDGWAKLWPEFEHRKQEHFRARPAVSWADQINVPVLILHSRNDSKIPVSQAFAIAEKLQQYKKEYELVIYGNDGHSLPLNRANRNQHIINWFQLHDSKEGSSR